MGARSSQNRGPGLNKSDGHLLEYYRKIFGSGGGGTNYVDPGAGGTGHTATGGSISDYVDGTTVYRAHIFDASGTFQITQLSSDFPAHVDYLVMAGGGGAGTDGFDPSPRGAGGGGAGGVHSNHPGLPEPRRGSDFQLVGVF